MRRPVIWEPLRLSSDIMIVLLSKMPLPVNYQGCFKQCCWHCILFPSLVNIKLLSPFLQEGKYPFHRHIGLEVFTLLLLQTSDALGSVKARAHRYFRGDHDSKKQSMPVYVQLLICGKEA